MDKLDGLKKRMEDFLVDGYAKQHDAVIRDYGRGSTQELAFLASMGKTLGRIPGKTTREAPTKKR